MTEIPGPGFSAPFPLRGWFARADPGFRREMLAMGRPKSYPAGKVIYHADDGGQDVFGIDIGVITIQCKFTHPDAVLVHMLRPGE